MNAGVISTRYARAIYEYAAEKDHETALLEQLQLLAQSFLKFPALRKVISDPTVTAEQKIQVLTTACDARENEILQQVIRLVVKNKRSGYIENIIRMYDEVYRKAKGIVTVQLTTVEPADDKIKEELLPVIARITEGTVDFQTQTDPGLIGGFILEIEDKRLDASVKEQLRMMSYEL
ncbi:MAG: F0F1 ATP synthase subunit delta [Dysgonamonadaceae bacterium]|jgi:F-type H+-transporting ATPase subunit delta|nr:F0F1 ATP synthase subunit delta [Dysgonamonadaceae bacterium]